MANSNSKTERKKTFKMQWNATTSNATRVFLFIVSEHCCICTKAISYPFLCSLHTTRTRLDERVYRNNKSPFFGASYSRIMKNEANFNDDSDERATAIFIRCFCVVLSSPPSTKIQIMMQNKVICFICSTRHKEKREWIQYRASSDVGLSVVSLSLICAFWCAHSELHFRTQFTHNLLSFRAQAAALRSTGTLENVNSTSTIDMLNDFSFSYSPHFFLVSISRSLQVICGRRRWYAISIRITLVLGWKLLRKSDSLLCTSFSSSCLNVI